MKRTKLWLIISLIVLGMAAIISQIAPSVFKEKKSIELLEVSVILREAEGNLWSNIRSGMEQAAIEQGVELRFLILPNENDGNSQKELFLRETKIGTDGIIIAPCDGENFSSITEEVSNSSPIISIETNMNEYGSKIFVGASSEKIGTALGTTALNGIGIGETAILVNSAPNNTAICERIAFAKSVLESSDRLVKIIELNEKDDFDQQIEEILSSNVRGILCFEAYISEAFGSISNARGFAPLIYGYGSTTKIAAFLEQGALTAIISENNFAIGYLAVDSMVKAIRKEAIQPLGEFDVSIIRRENMYDSENEKLLFPVY